MDFDLRDYLNSGDKVKLTEAFFSHCYSEYYIVHPTTKTKSFLKFTEGSCQVEPMRVHNIWEEVSTVTRNTVSFSISGRFTIDQFSPDWFIFAE